MKIRVITDCYEYMGLKKGIEADTTEIAPNSKVAFFMNMGKEWALSPSQYEVIDSGECRSSYCECEEGKCSGGKVDVRADEANKIKSKAGSEKKIPIKSDGGSSTYYDIDIPAWLLYTLNERQKEGKCYIKTEELIETAFGSDFDFANAFKSLVRAFGAMNGGGKAGNDVDYEMNKVQYSANKIKERNQRKEQK